MTAIWFSESGDDAGKVMLRKYTAQIHLASPSIGSESQHSLGQLEYLVKPLWRWLLYVAPVLRHRCDVNKGQRSSCVLV